MDSVLEDSDKKEYLHWVRLAYEKSGKDFYRKLRFIFIEIPKFTKPEGDLKTGIDRWFYLLKNLSLLQKIPAILNTRVVSKLFRIAKVSNLNKQEYMKYEKDLMASWDEYAIKKTIEHDRKKALEQGLEQGRELGLEQGLEQGREQGREQGLEEGMEKKSYEVVKNLLSKGKFTISEIANFANVTEAFVRKVKRK